MSNLSNKSKQAAILGMFGAIIFLLAFTPLGFIPLPFLRATTIHIPVIIGSLILGPKLGAVLGLMFGLASILTATLTPFPTSFVFSPLIPVPGTGSGSPFAVIVAIVPRVLVGVFPWYAFAGLRKLLGGKLDIISAAVAGVVGSLTNTIFVMHFIFFIFAEPWAYARNETADFLYGAILAIIAANGVPEAVVAAILVSAITAALMKAGISAKDS